MLVGASLASRHVLRRRRRTRKSVRQMAWTFPGMGNEASSSGLDDFRRIVRRELDDGERALRVFDIGGSGVKTALVSARELGKFLHDDGEGAAASQAEEPGALQWAEAPSLLGIAPGHDGFEAWLRAAVPSLGEELDDLGICFGVSVGGTVHHASGVLVDWWSGGGHPQELSPFLPKPTVASIMGLPSERTFVLHDGEAHLLGCTRCILPPPGLACLAIGTGVGLGLTDSRGAIVDPSSGPSMGQFYLNGAPLSGAPYKGVWQEWLERPGGLNERSRRVLTSEFANSSTPWRHPWVSLVLGRRGMELAEAAHACLALGLDADPIEGEEAEDSRGPAVRAFGRQWLHFLRTALVPQFCANPRRRDPTKMLCFAGGVAARNWPLLREVLVEAGASEPGKQSTLASGGFESARTSPLVEVLPLAPNGSALIGAAIYALAGIGGGSTGIWAR